MTPDTHYNELHMFGLRARLAGLALVVVLVAAFLLLNAGGVVDPRVHLVVGTVERPGVLGVLLLTWLAGAATGGLAVALAGAARARGDGAAARAQAAAVDRAAAVLRDVPPPGRQFPVPPR
jgi:hypothetical protein